MILKRRSRDDIAAAPAHLFHVLPKLRPRFTRTAAATFKGSKPPAPTMTIEAKVIPLGGSPWIRLRNGPRPLKSCDFQARHASTKDC
jgi:hypothetical protein